jgi:aflatoxin B1 aldehyde reductase
MIVNQNALIRMFQDVHNIRMTEAAQRWLQHHSALQPGDAVVLGAASPQQMEDNIVQWCVACLIDA